ncbi:crotonase/enoyl-CoA hydratase family protein [Methylotenera sp.]|uniref:crotonase/enoyl-CoA hydratase family protein n=1 Tax=Methylotenera sp. TaxID=2051956 RepID=UPI0024879E48|nr:crotonase/enoyl-CoA hydratase family protein [Methylotenera sp.]MDI1298633.1 crotonase/enoyl-CoA hydratase family protein [Methylotenera sp.]
MNATTNFGLTNNFKQVSTHYESSHELLWTFLSQEGNVPNFNSEIIKELTQHHEEIEKTSGILNIDGNINSIKYSVLASKRNDAFSLGGPLTLISELSFNKKREALADYAFKALHVLAQRTFRFNVPSIISITLLQGHTLGAGLEAALTSDVVIAERKSILGFPEILFNMFPGMGAYSQVARKAGTKIADKMILGGELFTAEQCYEMGLVDVLAEDGEGESAVYDWIRKNKRMSNGYLATQKAKNRVNPITYDELKDITTIWLDAAMQLTDRDYKMINRFISSQLKTYGATTSSTPMETTKNSVVGFKKTA